MNYNTVAPTYDRRYEVNRLEGVAALLRGLAAGAGGGAALEVGCGTGRWLAEVQATASHVVGLDLSPGMLGRARQREAAPSVVCGEAGALPFPSASFDMLYCVNAIHHFARPQGFMAEARRVLRRGG
ncbi:MAG: class I SAM-dependent methyltransferase, partial [Chloroflexi bacterium]|nr:class I SAM-dependent methyltransferase [Chloroflexota bacterium]